MKKRIFIFSALLLIALFVFYLGRRERTCMEYSLEAIAQASPRVESKEAMWYEGLE